MASSVCCICSWFCPRRYKRTSSSGGRVGFGRGSYAGSFGLLRNGIASHINLGTCASASSPAAATLPDSMRSSARSSARGWTPTATSSSGSATGGTILGTSRTNPYKQENGAQQVLDTLAANRIDALIPIGGEDTLGVAAKLA